jgi:hypothetical protein
MGSFSLQPQFSQPYANNEWVKSMCISTYSLMPSFSLLLPYILFISCTCWVPTISVLNLAIFSYYSNLLLRRRRWAGILRRGVLGYASPRLPFLWCYGVFRCSISPRVALVFKGINYVIIILYIYDIWLSVSTFGRMCGTIDPGSCIRWVCHGPWKHPVNTFPLAVQLPATSGCATLCTVASRCTPCGPRRGPSTPCALDHAMPSDAM